MIKIFYILFLVFFLYPSVFWSNDIKIISREEWWANENYRFVEWEEWQNIFKKWSENAIKYREIEHTKEEILRQKLRSEKLKNMKNILLNDYWEYIKVESVNKYENWKKLAWPITKVKKINAIVIHHTDTNYDNPFESINSIYKFHALTREWWDIWYNFLIWKNWEIFEWRAWWDYVVWAHNKWNNMWSVWIALMWDYSVDKINDKQYNSLKQLTQFLIKKYDIDLTEKTYFHEECIWNDCKQPLTTKYLYPIVWHRDAWHTSCPWDALYSQINQLRIELLKDPVFVKKLYRKRIYVKLRKFSDNKLIEILANIESSLDESYNKKNAELKDLLLGYFSYKNNYNTIKSSFNVSEKNIKIKLSYPDKNNITIKSWRALFKIKRSWNKIEIKWYKYTILKIPKKYQSTILQITSWNRKPLWDKKWKFNDNTFRWDLIVYVKNNELVVVNSLNIEDYLKWLWEVSDFENIEKIKTIIIAARSYANWYITKDRKFPWEFYDWIDDSNVFQKYLWYWLEQRSPNVNKIVNDTKRQIITYNWKLIKPWYFSNSNWNTVSFYEYCRIKYWDNICSKESKKYPYLQSVIDKWSIWLSKKWHWVWISWKWVSYFTDRWWTYDMIIKYFLKGVDVL